jgi:hypothetical protein
VLRPRRLGPRSSPGPPSRGSPHRRSSCWWSAGACALRWPDRDVEELLAEPHRGRPHHPHPRVPGVSLGVRSIWSRLVRRRASGCNRKVVGSNPTSGSKTAAQRVYTNLLPMTLLAPLIIPHARTWPREAPVRYVGRRPWQAAPTLRLFHCRVRLGSSLCPRRRRHHNSPFAR